MEKLKQVEVEYMTDEEVMKYLIEVSNETKGKGGRRTLSNLL